MKLKKELPLILIISIPFLYLGFIWDSLPETVPIHWNSKGQIDNWGPKSTLILVTSLLTILMYGLLTIIQFIDSKKKIQNMGTKYYNLKFFIILFMSALAIFILYSVKKQTIANPNLILMIIGGLFVVLGNYMKTIKANYFIGIRTPWTLENETVWKKTHILAGKLWFVGGLAIIICCFIFDRELSSTLFIGITLIISLIPVLYSYFSFKKLKK